MTTNTLVLAFAHSFLELLKMKTLITGTAVAHTTVPQSSFTQSFCRKLFLPKYLGGPQSCGNLLMAITAVCIKCVRGACDQNMKMV